MATNTYVALKSTTVTGSNAATVLFDNIPQGYTDLVLGVQGRFDSANQIREFRLRFNGDTGTNYSSTRLIGDGSSASSDRLSNFSNMRFGVLPAATATSGILGTAICNIQNYSNTTTYKTVLNRTSDPQGWVTAAVGLWRNTAAITSVEIAISETQTGNWLVGSTFTIYGIAAQPIASTAKATGGTITYDAYGNVIHTFTTSGTFTPTESLSVDYLVIAGGGGGGGGYGAGGGAGGYLEATDYAVTATGYTVTVGAGGGGGSSTNGATGSNSVFGAITAAGGGYGAGPNTPGSRPGGAGGSGGGAGYASGTAGAASPAGQGYPGGTGPAGFYGGAGGGGAGGPGQVGASQANCVGGIGRVSVLDGVLRASGGSGYSAAATIGGGGSGNGGTTSGTANTGGGGGTDNNGPTANGGNGGSGVVIIRYRGV